MSVARLLDFPFSVSKGSQSAIQTVSRLTAAECHFFMSYWTYIYIYLAQYDAETFWGLFYADHTLSYWAVWMPTDNEHVGKM